MSNVSLTTDSNERKNIPLCRGLLDYFPNALAEVAKLSQKANEKHNPGEDMHHARGKSMDHADCIMRHLADRGTVDPGDGLLHDVHVAWRALALLQETLEQQNGLPLPRGARLTATTPATKAISVCATCWNFPGGGFRDSAADCRVGPGFITVAVPV